MPIRKTTKRLGRTPAKPQQPREIRVRVALRDIQPPIWRELRLPEAYTLHQLHRIIQLVFGWLDYHLYEFNVEGRRFEGPDPEADGEPAATTSLMDLALRTGVRFQYVYDFGDYWAHEVQVLGFAAMPPESGPDWTPRLVGGGRAGPPEDCGGPPGYEQLLVALADPGQSDPEAREFRAWIDSRYDPERFDPWMADHSLALAAAWGAI